MDIRRVEYFIKVAETLSFSRAAAQLHISHQALSKQVQLLEEELGAKLLERSTTRVALTEVGSKVYDVFKPLMRELRYGYAEVLDFIGQKNRFLRVGYFNGLSYARAIAPVLRWLERREPELRVNMLATDLGMTGVLLEEDSIDLAIFPTFEEQCRWKSIVCFPVCRGPSYIIVSEQHPWYRKEGVTREELAQGTMLIYESRPVPGSQLPLSELEVARQVPAHNFDTYMDILRRGEAFGVVGETYSRREGEYRLLPLPESCRHPSYVVAAFKCLHPLRHVMNALRDLDSEAAGLAAPL